VLSGLEMSSPRRDETEDTDGPLWCRRLRRCDSYKDADHYVREEGADLVNLLDADARDQR
jgi:hypothetical protein